jgi:hypothetical protein
MALSLAIGTVMGATPGHHYALDRGVTTEARFSGALINTVFELEEASHPFSIHVI